jgi:light-harvesting complex 1 beta chain
MLGPGTYLTDAEAKEFHKGFVASMGFFTLVAILAHFLVWEWRPWLGPARAFAAVETNVQNADATPVATPHA